MNQQLPNKISHTSTTISEYYPRLQLTFLDDSLGFARCTGGRAIFTVWLEGLKSSAGDNLPSLPVLSCVSWAGFLASPSVNFSCLSGDLLLPLLWR